MSVTETELSRDAIIQTIGAIASQLPLLDAKRAGIELFGAPSFNAFTLFSPNENTLSRIAQDLFDPRGDHGQGPLFLNGLLKAIGIEQVGYLDVVKVEREARTDANRRIDLVIETPTALIGIENKPWAKQQENQLADYLDALRAWGGIKRVELIFLSHFNPDTAKGEVIEVTFAEADDERPSLEAIFRDVRPNIRAARIVTHIDEFMRYISERWGDQAVTTEKDQVFIEVVEKEFAKPKARRAIAAILAAQDKLHRQVLDEIGKYILSRLGSDFEVINQEILADCLTEKDYSWQLRKSVWPNHLAISLAAGKADMSNIYYGVDAADPRSEEVRAYGEGCTLRPQLDKALKAVRGGRSTVWMPWWDWAESGHWNSQYTAGLLVQTESGRAADHPEIIRLGNAFVSLAEQIDQIIENS